MYLQTALESCLVGITALNLSLEAQFLVSITCGDNFLEQNKQANMQYNLYISLQKVGVI